MKKFSLKPKNIKPGILLDKKSGKMEISGKSCPENAIKFYEPVMEWIDEYLQDPNPTTVFEFKLNYLNSVSLKVILKLLIKLEAFSKKGHEVVIKWYYKDWEEDLEEIGKDFKSSLDLNIELISVKDVTDQNDFFDKLMDDIL